MRESSSFTSAAVRPSGAITDRPAGSLISDRTRSGEGRRPTIPQQEAGMRIDPPMSVPIPTVAIPAQTAAALPPLDPPGVMPARQGLFVAGNTGFGVPPAAPRPPKLVSSPPPAPAPRAPSPPRPSWYRLQA